MSYKVTTSTMFLVPTLKINKDHLLFHNFINAYIKDIDRETEYENCVFLLFQPKNIGGFNDFIDYEYNRTEKLPTALVDDYDYPPGFVVLIYTLDPKWQDDFRLIKAGKYSKTSTKFQELFPKVTKIISNGKYKDEISMQYRIFKKAEELKEYWEDRIGSDLKGDVEVWKMWDDTDETLNISKVKQLV